MIEAGETETANLRWNNKGATSVNVWVDEEQSRDKEIRHRREVVGYLIVDDLLAVENQLRVPKVLRMSLAISAPVSRLEDERKSGAIWYVIFR